MSTIFKAMAEHLKTLDQAVRRSNENISMVGKQIQRSFNYIEWYWALMTLPYAVEIKTGHVFKLLDVTSVDPTIMLLTVDGKHTFETDARNFRPANNPLEIIARASLPAEGETI